MIGILDWELSTLGNQMCDVAISCLVSRHPLHYSFLHGKAVLETNFFAYYGARSISFYLTSFVV